MISLTQSKISSRINAWLLVPMLSLVLGACASGPSTKTGANDPAAANRSQVYLSQVVSFSSQNKLPGAGSCAVPAGAEKVVAKTAAGPSLGWREMVGRASTCVTEKNWKMLETLANLIARNDIDSPWGPYFLSVAAEAAGDHHRAMWMIELAQKKAGGRSALFAYQRGHIWLKAKEIGKAMADFEKALVLEPTIIDAHLFLGLIYQRDLELNKAAPHYEAVLQSEPKNYQALVGLAEAKLADGGAQPASELYQRAVSAQPQHLESWMRLAYINEMVLKNPTLALSTYKSLRSSMNSGTVKGKPEIDVTAKIKALEAAAEVARDVAAKAARQPAQTAAAATTSDKQDRSAK